MPSAPIRTGMTIAAGIVGLPNPGEWRCYFMEATPLRDKARAELPQNVLALMDDIEAFAGREIQFEFNHLPPPTEYPEAAASYVQEDKARILLREAAPISAQDVLHELLHIQRYWVEGVPQLEPADGDWGKDDNWATTAQIENSLEHLVILPREADYRFSPRPKFTEIAQREWSEYPWPDVQGEFQRRFVCYMRWLACETIPDEAVRALAKDCLTREGVFGDAERLRKTVLRRLPNKRRSLAAVVRALGIPADGVQLTYLDAKEGTRRHEALPAL